MPKITVAGGPSNAAEPVGPQERPGEGKYFRDRSADQPSEPAEAAETSEETVETVEPVDYSELTGAQLSDELERRGLPKSGTKPEQIARLEADDAKDEE